MVLILPFSHQRRYNHILTILIGAYAILPSLFQYMDEVLLAGYQTVTIIHGHGTGALRQGVHKYLKKNKHVASFRFGGAGEGGTGATVVELK